MARHILHFLAVLAILSSVGFAETVFHEQVCGNSIVDSVFGRAWLGNVGIAFFTSIMILAFIYMMGIMLQKSAWNGFIRLELFELFMTAIIFGIMLVLIQEMCSINAGAIYPDLPQDIRDYSLFSISAGEPDEQGFRGGLFNRLSRSIEAWMVVNYGMNVWADQLASITVYARPLGVGMVTSPLSGIGVPIKQLLYNATVALSIMYIINAAQHYVMQFSTIAFLNYYLPIGIFLRSFTPTRRIGGTLIALSVAFILVMPLLNFAAYLIIFGTASTGGPGLNMTSSIERLFSSSAVFGNGQSLGDTLSGLFTKSDIFAIVISGFIAKTVGIPNTAVVGILLAQVFGANLFGDLLLLLVLLPLSTVGIAAVAGLLSALNIMLLVQSTKYLSKSLGEEIDVTSLTRMI